MSSCFRLRGIVACSMLACFCMAQDSVRPALPPETSINQGAGRGDELLVKIRLEKGEELLFIVDTGASATMLDSSFEPALGKRLGKKTFRWADGKKQTAGVYQAPNLYLGNAQLAAGASTVLTADLRNKSVSADRAIKGILGIDTLRHYCIQLDFETAKMRFLDPDHPRTEDWGRAFLLSFARSTGHPVLGGSLIGVSSTSSEIDTGCNFDGVLTPELFQRWRNQRLKPSVGAAGEAHFPNGVFGGNSYSNLYLSGDGRVNLVGLNFLARHLVTLNFPKRTIYLRQRSVGSLAEGNGFFDDFYPRELWDRH